MNEKMLKHARTQARKQWESLYEGTCDIYTYQQSYNADRHCLSSEKVLAVEGVPCRCALPGSGYGYESKTVSKLEQDIRLYLAPEVDIPAGSEITVTQANWKAVFKSSGTPRKYVTHQEVALRVVADKA